MKGFAKVLSRIVASGAVLPLMLLYWAGGSLFGKEKVFPGFSQLVSLAPGLVGQYLRHAFYRRVLGKCDRDACICFGTVFSHCTAKIGRKVYVGVYCVLGDVTLEDDVLVGSRVSIINGNKQHGTARLDIPIREQPGQWPNITVGRDTWIGDGAIVMANVGKHCIVGAGAVVTKSVPDYAIVAGNPAIVVRERKGAHGESDSVRSRKECRKLLAGTAIISESTEAAAQC